MWTYRIDIGHRRVYALWNGQQMDITHYLPFHTLAVTDPAFLNVADDGRRQVYLIARDEMIDRDLITVEE